MNLAILQARMSSNRLPGKVLADVLGRPMIERQIERLRRARTIDHLMVATSEEASDDPLAAWAEAAGVEVYRGVLNDVLARYCGALRRHPEAAGVLRLTADCPLADWTVIDDLVDLWTAEDADYAHLNVGGSTFPHGLDCEVMRAQALFEAERDATDPYDREHVTPFLRNSGRYRIVGLRRDPPLAHLRWTVDFPEDLAFVREVYAQLYPQNPAFTSEDIIALPKNSSEAAR